MPWKFAASLLMVADGMRVLLLRRSARSPVFPSSFVYPGGGLDAADSSADWLRLLGRFMDASPEGQRSTFQSAGRAPVFVDCDAACRPLLPEVAFRLCALRETFEESGLLLTRDAAGARVCHDADTDAFDVAGWQAAVRRDASEFLSLHSSLRACPDLQSLREWANWLTPSTISPRGRFDTAFFVCDSPNQRKLRVSLDTREMQEHRWVTPQEAMDAFEREAEFFMTPPTMYEMRKLAACDSVQSLVRLADCRGLLGLQRFLPVVAETRDCVLTLHPGDCRYPELPDPEAPDRLDLRHLGRDDLDGDRRVNRVVFRQGDKGKGHAGLTKFVVQCWGFTPEFGCPAPVC